MYFFSVESIELRKIHTHMLHLDIILKLNIGKQKIAHQQDGYIRKSFVKDAVENLLLPVAACLTVTVQILNILEILFQKLL